jgi:glycosyltransferase involved in cell wall biosynthesis
VLACRPVVTSTLCPAIEYVRDAVVEVPPDDVRAYGDAILRLADDRVLYAQKRENCAAAGSQFYDPARAWGATLKRVLHLIGLLPGAVPAPSAISSSSAPTAREPAAAR